MWHLLWPTMVQESFLSFSSRQSLFCCLSLMAKGSTPKSCDSDSCKNLGVPTLPKQRGPLYLLFSPKLCGPLPSPPRPRGPLPGMSVPPRFKSQCQFFSAAPFLTPPTISYTCQHSCIFPALLGCHSKSGQVWPHGMEPVFSKLSRRCCNQGELLPSYILGGSHSHPPGWKHGHSYLTCL